MLRKDYFGLKRDNSCFIPIFKNEKYYVLFLFFILFYYFFLGGGRGLKIRTLDKRHNTVYRTSVFFFLYFLGVTTGSYLLLNKRASAYMGYFSCQIIALRQDLVKLILVLKITLIK